MGESFLIQMNCEYYRDFYMKQMNYQMIILYDNRSYVLGSMFGGHKNALPQIM